MAHAVISGGSVAEIVVDYAGSGYTSPPTVLIGAPPVSMQWDAQGGVVTDDGAERSVTDTNALDAVKFYRVRVSMP